MKLAVVLLNLGGPLRREDIRPFLFSFFNDEHVVTLPQPLRAGLAAWIAWRRSKGAAKRAYGQLGGKSPLLENTQEQARALEALLPGAKVFVCMRHWHPRAAVVAKEVAAFAPDKIILLPLYPQYSTTTTLSALKDWRHAARHIAPTQVVCCYPEDAGFIAASAALVQEGLQRAQGKTRLLFSAHGLPEKIVQAGDPYQKHCEQTAAAIVKKLDMPGLDWELCYQSRVGRLKWIGPSIGEALQKAARDGCGVVIYPLAFVSEHVETLVELDIEYKHRAAALGISSYVRVPAAGVQPQFVAGLRDLVLSSARRRNCPAGVTCYCEGRDG